MTPVGDNQACLVSGSVALIAKLRASIALEEAAPAPDEKKLAWQRKSLQREEAGLLKMASWMPAAAAYLKLPDNILRQHKSRSAAQDYAPEKQRVSGDTLMPPDLRTDIRPSTVLPTPTRIAEEFIRAGKLARGEIEPPALTGLAAQIVNAGRRARGEIEVEPSALTGLAAQIVNAGRRARGEIE